MIFIKILLFIYILSFFISLKDRSLLIVTFLASIALFVITYTFIDNSFADDRGQYYYIFINYNDFFVNHQDTSLLYLFKFLNLFIYEPLSFYFVISLIFILLFYYFIKKHLTFEQMILFTILIVLNRLYLDFEMNVMRSTLASVLLLVFYTRIVLLRRYYYIAFLPIAFYMHIGLVTMILFLFLVSSRINYKSSYVIFIIGFLIFLFDINLSNLLLNNIDILNYLKIISNNIYDFINPSLYVTSIKLKIQFIIYAVIPIYLLNKYRNNYLLNNQLNFILFGVGTVLIFYNSFPIIIRALSFFIPLIYFSFVQNFSFRNKVSVYYISFIVLINSIIFYKNIDYINI
jgi:hypothetical protein